MEGQPHLSPKTQPAIVVALEIDSNILNVNDHI